ncbi:hypothetical protein V1477_010511 [Vespula maculifrons]|uniref:Uncharacterized protein n=1 Tax=Vespula maculifrons TaxID=7453 RepID=A0ABD2C4R6_VESMC
MSGLKNFCWMPFVRNPVAVAHVTMKKSRICIAKIKIKAVFSQCITEVDLNQLRCRPTSFSTNYKSSTLNFDINRGPLWSGHEAKERLYVEEAPIKCGSKGIYNTIELFSTVPQNSSKMALSHILILPCCHSKCSYIVVIHDRSCLEMSEADGVDVGAFCKRGFIQLQFPEKLEAPEAERHHGSVESPLVRGSPAAATSKRWDPGRVGNRGTNHRGIFTWKKGMSNCFRTRMIGKTLTRVTADTRVGVRDREI